MLDHFAGLVLKGLTFKYCEMVISSYTFQLTLRKKCLLSEFFWSVFSRIRTEGGEIRSISLYSTEMQENTDQKNSEYEHFLRSVVIFFNLVSPPTL